MDASFDNRLGLLMADGGFDPVAEIRHLRQDLMVRLQRLQQVIALEAEQGVEKTETPQAPPSEVFPKSETVLYVSSDAPAAATVRINPLPIQPKNETPIEEVAEICVGAPPEPATDSEESVLIRTLRRLNAVLVAIGVVGASIGLGYFVFRKQLTNPQELAVILLAAGAAMVFVGIIGGLAHRFSGNTVPGSFGNTVPSSL